MSGKTSGALALLALLFGVACVEDLPDDVDLPVDEPVPVERAPAPGLVPLAQVKLPSGSHLGELLIHDGRVYVANSNEGFAIYSLDEGGFARVSDSVEGARCTTLALHEASASLYCASDDSAGVLRFDLADPRAPALDSSWMPIADRLGLPVRDLEVAGDRLWLALYDRGLGSAAIGPAGELGRLIEHRQADGSVDNVRLLAADGDTLWVSSVDAIEGGRLETRLGVYAIESGEDARLLASVVLDGPPLALAVDGSQALVGLGSSGARLVRFDPAAATLELGARLETNAFVTAVELDAEMGAAIAASSRGVALYDLREDPPRRVGWQRGSHWSRADASGAILDVELHAGELVVSDWSLLHRLGLDLDGEPRGVELARGVFVAAASPVELRVRSQASFEQRVEFVFAGEVLEDRELGAGEDILVELPAERFPLAEPSIVGVRVSFADELLAQQSVTVLRRAPLDQVAIAERGQPPPGASMPEVVIATGSREDAGSLRLPLRDRGARYVFYTPDCAAMWPEIDDLVWRARNGELDVGAAVLIAEGDIDGLGFARRMHIEMLDGLRYGYSSAAVPASVAALDPSGWVDAYAEAFYIAELPGAAYHPTDYEVDAAGVVVTVERDYWGAHGL